jgi:hypothetical protein
MTTALAPEAVGLPLRGGGMSELVNLSGRQAASASRHSDAAGVERSAASAERSS